MLNEIGAEFAMLDELIEASDGELTPEAEQLLADLNLEEAGRIDGLSRYVRHLKLVEEDSRAESKRYARRAQAAERRIEWLKAHIQGYMFRRGLDKIETRLHKVTLGRVGGLQAIEYDIGLLPEEYVKSKVLTAADTDKLRAALEAGTEVPGAALKARQMTVYIK